MSHTEEQEYLQNLGEKLQKLRKKRGLTQEQLAESIGTKHSQIGRLERGETNSTILVLRKIAKELSVPLTELVDVDGKTNQ